MTQNVDELRTIVKETIVQLREELEKEKTSKKDYMRDTNYDSDPFDDSRLRHINEMFVNLSAISENLKEKNDLSDALKDNIRQFLIKPTNQHNYHGNKPFSLKNIREWLRKYESAKLKKSIEDQLVMIRQKQSIQLDEFKEPSKQTMKLSLLVSYGYREELLKKINSFLFKNHSEHNLDQIKKILIKSSSTLSMLPYNEINISPLLQEIAAWVACQENDLHFKDKSKELFTQPRDKTDKEKYWSPKPVLEEVQLFDNNLYISFLLKLEKKDKEHIRKSDPTQKSIKNHFQNPDNLAAFIRDFLQEDPENKNLKKLTAIAPGLLDSIGNIEYLQKLAEQLDNETISKRVVTFLYNLAKERESFKLPSKGYELIGFAQEFDISIQDKIGAYTDFIKSTPRWIRTLEKSGSFDYGKLVKTIGEDNILPLFKNEEETGFFKGMTAKNAADIFRSIENNDLRNELLTVFKSKGYLNEIIIGALKSNDSIETLRSDFLQLIPSISDFYAVHKSIASDKQQVIKFCAIMKENMLDLIDGKEQISKFLTTKGMINNLDDLVNILKLLPHEKLEHVNVNEKTLAQWFNSNKKLCYLLRNLPEDHQAFLMQNIDFNRTPRLIRVIDKDIINISESIANNGQAQNAFMHNCFDHLVNQFQKLSVKLNDQLSEQEQQIKDACENLKEISKSYFGESEKKSSTARPFAEAVKSNLEELDSLTKKSPPLRQLLGKIALAVLTFGIVPLVASIKNKSRYGFFESSSTRAACKALKQMADNAKYSGETPTNDESRPSTPS